MMDHPSAATGTKAAEVIGNFGEKAVPALTRALADPDDAVRAAAAGSLGGGFDAVPPGASSIEPLLRALKDKDASVRAATAESLGGTIGALYGPAGHADMIEEAFPNLEVSDAGALAMKAIAADAFAPITGRPALQMIRALSGEEAAAGWEGPLRDGLTAALADPDAVVRQNAAKSLGTMATRAEQALDPLLQRLGDPDEKVRSAVAEAIGCLGPAAVPRLAKSLAGDNAHIRAVAAKALECEKPAMAIRPWLDALVKALEDPDADVRVQAVQSLALTSSYDREAFRRLAPRMVDPLLKGLKEIRRRASASRPLEWTAPETGREAESIPALIAALDDPDVEVRKNAAVALRAFGDRAVPAVPALGKACKDPDHDVRAMAANAIDVIVH